MVGLLSGLAGLKEHSVGHILWFKTQPLFYPMKSLQDGAPSRARVQLVNTGLAEWTMVFGRYNELVFMFFFSWCTNQHFFAITGFPHPVGSPKQNPHSSNSHHPAGPAKAKTNSTAIPFSSVPSGAIGGKMERQRAQLAVEWRHSQIYRIFWYVCLLTC